VKSAVGQCFFCLGEDLKGRAQCEGKIGFSFLLAANSCIIQLRMRPIFFAGRRETMGINGIEWILIFIVALILFGPKKLPDLGRALGKSIREFKNATNGLMDDDDKKENPQAIAATVTEPASAKAEVKKEEVKSQTN
jgi:sec-independent protein translocase protein TatA